MEKTPVNTVKTSLWKSLKRKENIASVLKMIKRFIHFFHAVVQTSTLYLRACGFE